MGLRSGLALYCYTPNASVLMRYVGQLASLQFSSAAPGGFGDLQAMIKLPPGQARLPQPQFQPFARLAVMGHGLAGVSRALWLGEVSEYTLEMAKAGGEQVTLTGLGIGNCMRDDPQSVSYSTKTAQQIAVDQLTGNINAALAARANAWPLSQDTSLLFADNPATQFSPAYVNKNGEECIQDIATLAGDYMWGVWAHPTQTDAAGFPKGQLSVALRDTSTTHYTASVLARDIVSFTIAQSMDQAYNDIRITSYDTTNGVQVSEAKDTRLGASGAQGSAPFRQRALLKSYEGISTVTQSQAATIANTMLTQMKNVGSKVQMTLAAVRDANGNPIPLEEVQAGKNIFVPEMAVRGTQLATSAVAGVNQFYILSARYKEGGNGYQLELECDNYADASMTPLARLQLLADALARTQRSASEVQAGGASVKGWYSIGPLQPSAGGLVFGVGVNYGTTLTSAPTSVTVSAVATTNCGAPSASNLGTTGFVVSVTSSAAGAMQSAGTFLTVGN